MCTFFKINNWLFSSAQGGEFICAKNFMFRMKVKNGIKSVHYLLNGPHKTIKMKKKK